MTQPLKPEDKKIWVLFHHPCSDGTGAKYAAWKKFGDSAHYVGVNYNQPVVEVPDGAALYIIDFSYPREVMRKFHDSREVFVCLDHHKTAKAALEGETYAIFDMDRSGAVMAWEYFHPGVPVPTLLQMVQDRDLWQWKVPGSKSALNFLALNEGDMNYWDKYKDVPLGMVTGGESITKYQESLLKWAFQGRRVAVKRLWGYNVAILNTNVLPSEMGEALYEIPGVDMSMTYSLDGDGTAFLSFRSKNPTGPDVSAIAKGLNGGGHKHSAGGRTTIDAIKAWTLWPNAEGFEDGIPTTKE